MISKKDVGEISNSILESRANTKKIPDLVNALDHPKLVKTVLSHLHKVFATLSQRGDLKPVNVNAEKSEAVVKYSKWLTQVYEVTLGKVASILNEPESDGLVKELSLTTYMKLFVLGSDKELVDKWSQAEIQRLNLIVETLLSSDKDHQPTIERFQEYLEYPDVKYYTIQCLTRHPRMSRQCSKDHNRTFRQNILKFLEILNYEGKNEPSSGILLENYQWPEESMSKNFNTLWHDFAQLHHKEVDIYKRCLIVLTDKVLPRLKNPLVFTDFLMNSYEVGGSISLLALNGVFFLMSKHNLEYPAFYEKLYSLCTPELMHAKYRARFFHLANIFLASSHLPEYLVAAFIKRFSRMSLTAPSDAIVMLLHFIGNLLLRHKGLLKMIDNAEEHYDAEQSDPKLCRAVESGLWEIKTLQNHCLPQIAQAAKFINKKLPSLEWNVDEYLEITFDEMFQTEAKKKIFVNVPLTFERPLGLKFAKNDYASVHFSCIN